LTALRGVADARGAVDSDPNVSVLADVRFRCVKSHADANLSLARPPEPRERELPIHGRLDGVPGTIEGDEKPIASRIDLASSVRCEGVAQQATMVCTDCGEGFVT
jgi:hypothetical protein